jgi:hypothetical protein
MEKVIMTFDTLDKAGKQIGTVDVEFAVDQKAAPANSVTRFKFTSTPPVAANPPLEFRISWSDALQFEQLVTNILSANQS